MRRRTRTLLLAVPLLLCSLPLWLVVTAAAIGFCPMELLALARSRWQGCTVADAYRAGRGYWRAPAIPAAVTLTRESGLSLVQVRGERWWVPNRNAESLPAIMAEVGGYNDREINVRPGDIVLDCGAYVGLFSRRALRAGARLVVAIEIAPENIECLRRNLAADVRGGRAIIYSKGVWSRAGQLRLEISEFSSSADSVALKFPGSWEGPVVSLTTIDALVKELALPRIDLIKMDIEGAEAEALAGAAASLAKFRPRMILSIEHKPDDIDTIPRLLRRLWPEAGIRCGPCILVHRPHIRRVQPEVMFVR